jgi:MFS transporter, FHS family, glucose/mannose:H+ symporter
VKLRILVIHLGFALTGIVTTMLGPLLPLFATQWHFNDAQAGRLFLVQFIASPTGSLVASKVLSRWGAAWTVPIGMFMIAFGVTSVSLGTLASAIVGIALYGAGLGFALPSTNLLVFEMVKDESAAALNILNFSWTLGALAAPMAITAMLQPIGLRGFLLLVGALILIIAAIEVVAFPKRGVVEPSVRQGKLAPDQRVLFAVMAFVFLFLYVGIENGFAGWVPTFSIRSQQTSPGMTAFVQSSFWAAILMGRLMAPLALRAVSPVRLVLFGLAAAATGILLAVGSPSVPVLEAGVLLSGFGLAAVFPTGISIFAEWYGTGGTGSIVLGCCGLGGALVPWLVGVVSDRSHNLRLGLAVTLACLVVAALAFHKLSSAAHRSRSTAARA